MENTERTLISRRTAIKTTAIATGAAAVGGAGILYATQPAVAFGEGTITASDFSLADNEQDVETVTIRPQLDIEYQNVSSGVNSAEIIVDTDINAGLAAGDITPAIDAETVVTTWNGQQNPAGVQVINMSENAGVDGTELDATGLLSDVVEQLNPGAPVNVKTAKDLTADADINNAAFPQGIQDNEAAASEVTLTYTVNLYTDDGSGGENVITDTKTATFQVVVDNPVAESDTSGDSETGGDGSDGT